MDDIGETLPFLPLADEQDRDILLHREIHFSGSFDAMLEYYRQEDAKGISQDIDFGRIHALAEVEKAFGKNIAPLLLSGVDAEKVARMRKLYRDLRSVAESSPSTPEGLLAHYILSEDPIDVLVQAAPETLLKKPEIIIPFISSEEFADPLSPGYGLAPLLAVELIGKARSQEAIKPLFQCIGSGSELLESAALSALRSIGEAAKNFSKKILMSRPVTSDTERAVLVLTQFLPDENISALFAEQLRDSTITGTLRQYLSLG